MLLTSAAKNLLQSRVQVEHELLELLFLRLSVVLGGQRERDCHLGWCWSGSCWRVVSLAVVGSKTYADPRIRLKFVRPLCQEFRSTFRDRTGLSCPWILFFSKKKQPSLLGVNNLHSSPTEPSVRWVLERINFHRCELRGLADESTCASITWHTTNNTLLSKATVNGELSGSKRTAPDSNNSRNSVISYRITLSQRLDLNTRTHKHEIFYWHEIPTERRR